MTKHFSPALRGRAGWLAAGLITALLLPAPAQAQMRDMQVLVRRPARVVLPEGVKKIVVVNASGGRGGAVAEGVLTGEVPGRDRNLSERCLSGFADGMGQSGRYSLARATELLPAATSSSTGFGALLNWPEVERLAQAAKADAVLVLEYFDTDFAVLDMDAADAEPPIFARGTATVSAGFRLYLPRERRLLWENPFRITQRYMESAATYGEAVARLTTANAPLSNLSFETGQSVGRLFVAHERWEGRQLYTARKGRLQTGQRLASANQWEEAARVWREAFEREKPKDKAKAAYNLALANEVLGNIAEAKHWIAQAYAMSGARRDLDYSQILDERLAGEAALESQR